MKKQILVVGLLLISAVLFGQKKEIKKAEKANSDSKFAEAITNLNAAEGLLSGADNDTKAQFYAAKGEAYLGSAGTDFAKLKIAAESYSKAVELDPSNKLAAQMENGLINLRAKLVNDAIKDQDADRFSLASEKLYTSYMITKRDTSDLFYAANNAYNAKEIDKATQYYQTLLDLGFSGATKDFVATNKATGEVQPFDNKNIRDIAVRSGEYIKPEEQITSSKRGEILRSLAFIYLDKGETEKAKGLIENARAENPNDTGLMSAEADLAYRSGDTKKFNTLMEQIAASDPTNPEVFYNLGVGYADVGENEKALGYLNKALEIKPDHDSALIKISLIKLGEEDTINEEMNKLGTSSADNKRYDALKQKKVDLYIEVAPILEKAAVLRPDDIGVLRTLMNMYTQMGDEAKSEVYRVKLKAIEGGE